MGKRSMIPVRAKVRTMDGFWAHADQHEILRWLGSFKNAPKKTFVIHGEPPASEALANLLREKLKWSAGVPRNAAVVVLS
jgi:metallo-beta-lactamase family protein